ncbi:MAG: TatD family hydrolase [Bacteroidia bacterium]
MTYFCRMLTDTHTHLYSAEFDEDRETMIKRAMDEGINRFFLPNVDDKSIEPMMHIVEQYPDNCFPMMGLHPCSVESDYKQKLKIIERWLANGKYYAVGEIGLDYFWSKAYVNEQKDVFLTQVRWATELNLPVVIHSRDSFDDIAELLMPLKSEKLRGVFHCFTGNEQQAEKAKELEFFLGLGGVVTFKNSGLDKTLAAIDLKEILLETDAPYLAPVPHRGKRNEAMYLKLIAQKVAEIKELSLEEVAAITTENSGKLFNA